VLDEIRVYGRPLSEDEVRLLYETGKKSLTDTSAANVNTGNTRTSENTAILANSRADFSDHQGQDNWY